MSAAFVSLCIFGAFFFYTGVHSLCRPKQFGEMLSLQPIGRSGLIEIRAQYGGFFLAAALSQFAGLTALISIQTSFIVSLIIFGGLITGRFIALFDREDTSKITAPIMGLFFIDGCGALLSVVALKYWT